ncbi:cytochrome-c peroxidase [Myroides sp. M-43]|uniref:cytochrome-c peroxidase n=1 Tax=Myroides oncorhynchi TaxID=2893756 RepID=UPI001E558866|nr:cytochrome c peroxidase [Myroides oncorhynchi]MCC9041795.1 cytochrome-c peroxidase [Myroides oncorhynchi]
MKKIVRLFMFSFLLIGCSSNEDYEEPIEDIDNLAWSRPTNFPEPTYPFINNDLKHSRFELGKKLFHDSRFSQDNTVSCASCHIKSAAFADAGKPLSVGIDGQLGKRNAPAIQNMAFIDEYFYDGASNNLEMVPIVPIYNELEMRGDIPIILDKLRLDIDYQKLFKKAYNDDKMTSTNMMKALAQYMALLVSSNSKYDKYVRNELGGTLNEQEKRGLELFRQNCAACHKGDLFTDVSFRNNGVPVNPLVNDKGREEVSGLEEDRYKFKVSTVRNIALTAPYMHDGSLATLEAVLDFYSSGMKDSPTLDPLFKKSGGAVGIPMTTDEKKAIIAFLHTLTDYEFINNPKF